MALSRSLKGLPVKVWPTGQLPASTIRQAAEEGKPYAIEIIKNYVKLKLAQQVQDPYTEPYTMPVSRNQP